MVGDHYLDITAAPHTSEGSIAIVVRRHRRAARQVSGGHHLASWRITPTPPIFMVGYTIWPC
jgi:hypothetical protein